MTKTKSIPRKRSMSIQNYDGFINVSVSKTTRNRLHSLKKRMQVSSQAEVIEQAISIAYAIDQATEP